MIVRSKAPLRIGFAGGGTDLSPYCDVYGGCVLNATINLYVYSIIKESQNSLILFKAPDIDLTEQVPVEKEVPLNGVLDLHKAVYNKIVKNFDCKPQSFEITTFSDVPPGSGLGSSSTLVVSMIKAYSEWLNLPLGENDIALLAYEIERKDLGLSGGKQDQYAATYGGFNFMEFFDNDRVIINPLPVKHWIQDELQASLVLFYSGISRTSSKITDQIIEEQKITQASDEKSDNKALNAMHSIKSVAFNMKESILTGNTLKFAEELNYGWEMKKNSAKSVSNKHIEEIFQIAFENGAIAAKLSGAGGGGFILFMVDPIDKITLIRALKQKDGEVVQFEFTNNGCKSWWT